jgi:tRNA A37 threonylcarbamoyladenosine dehydratase
MKTAVEQLEKQILDNWMDILTGKVYIGDLFDQAKEMEKVQLLQMSLKSAHYERKWILEHSTESQYNPSKVEIRDLEKTALEHYNETFKQQEQ